MSLTIFQKGFNYSQDGIGNRLVYHLQGCNLHCPWCSNPEGMDFISTESKTVSTKELMNEIHRCKPMFFDGGGVTFTGGEATCQFEGIKEILSCLHEEKISTAIETNGTSPRLPELFDQINELIIDFKHPDTQRHKAVIGSGNEMIMKNLAKAFDNHPNVLVHIPLIGGFNTSAEDMKQFVDFFTTHNTSHARFEILLYHEYGKDKWAKCGKSYTVTNAFVTEETRITFENMLKVAGLNIIRT